MSYPEVESWLRQELQRRVGAATRSLVAAVQAAADEASNSNQLSLTLQQVLHFKSSDAEAIAPELLRRLAAAEAAVAAAAAAAGEPFSGDAEKAEPTSKKRPRPEGTPCKWFLLALTDHHSGALVLWDIDLALAERVHPLSLHVLCVLACSFSRRRRCC